MNATSFKSIHQQNRQHTVQPKLTVSAPGDRYEQEADAMADWVMRMPFKGSPLQQTQGMLASSVQLQSESIIQKDGNDNAPSPEPQEESTPANADNRIDWFEMTRPFYTRGATSLLFGGESLYYSVENVWDNNYLFFRTFGLGDDLAVEGANFFTPFTIDSALSRDFPTLGEQFEREANISSIILNPTLFTFDIHDIPGTLRMPLFKFFGADQSNPYAPSGTIHRKCADCEKEEKKNKNKPLMRKTEKRGGFQPSSDFATSLGSSKGGGSPLPDSTRGFMENAFSADFSKVRVHTDSRAAEMSHGIQARAFTHGRDIYFNKGQYQLGSNEGKRLLAHELTHVVQQNNVQGPHADLRREEEAPVKRTDLIIVGEGWDGSDQLAKVLKRKGTKIINVTSTEDLKKNLEAINFPVGTIYFITHATASGSMKFGGAEGFVTASALSHSLSGVLSEENAPERLDFRGCNIGKDPQAMNSMGTALGAKSILAGNCFAVLAHSTPIKIGGKKITKASQINDSNRKVFKDLMKKTADLYGNRKKCILNPTEKGFLAAGGEFVLLWFNPTFTGDWLPGISTCYSDASTNLADGTKPLPETSGCQITQVEIGSATAAEGAEIKESEE